MYGATIKIRHSQYEIFFCRFMESLSVSVVFDVSTAYFITFFLINFHRSLASVIYFLFTDVRGPSSNCYGKQPVFIAKHRCHGCHTISGHAVACTSLYPHVPRLGQR